MKRHEFTIPCVPPKATAQQQRTAVINGQVRKFDPKNVRQAKGDLMSLLYPNRPVESFVGPLRLVVTWVYPYRNSEPKKNRNGLLPCDTRPDCDNLAKAVTDCMTRAGFWTDDSQVAELTFRKYWGAIPGIKVEIEALGGVVG